MRKILLAGCCGVAIMVSGAGLGQTPPAPAPVPAAPPAAPMTPAPPLAPSTAPAPSQDERARAEAEERTRMEAEDRTRAEERARAAESWIADRADAELAQLKVRLRLTAEQDGQWSGFQAAMRDMLIADGRAQQEWEMRREDERRRGRAMRDERRRDREERRGDNREMRGEDRPDEIAALREEADSMTRRADNLRKIADAADPLYRTLNDPQRQRLMRFLSSSLH